MTAGTQTWTLARGQEGTTAASHASGVVVKIEQTKGSSDSAVQLTPTAQQTGDLSISGTVTAGTALSGPLAGSNLTGSVAIARLPTETNSADTSSGHLVTADDTRLSNTRTPTSHASTHNVGGSDVLEDLTRQAAGPGAQVYSAWTCDPLFATTTSTITAGVLHLMKIMTAHAFTINNIDFGVAQAGTGVTALANCFIGIYDSGGTRRFASSDQSSAWATPGAKSISLGGSAYTVTAGDYIYIAFLVGTQSTTVLRFYGLNTNAGMATGNISGATLRFATQLSTQTSLPSPTITLASNSNAGVWFFAAVK